MCEREAWRTGWSIHTPGTLRLRAQELGASVHLIEGLIPARSNVILLGDSGLGKSPLVYQAGISIAAGVPFLGRETTRGRVLIADFENGIGDISELVERISGYLGLPGPPDDVLLWSLNDCDLRYGQPEHTLLDMLRDVRPALAIIDSLGSYDPDAEEKNSSATKMIQEFRLLARDCGTATTSVHHRRKQSRNKGESTGPLETTILRHWFQDARGASSLVNGSDIRLGVDEPDQSAAAKDEVSLVLRGFGRMRGEIGPLYLARDRDENGDPLGYRRLIGSELLFNEDQRNALITLSQQFSFKDAKVAYSRADQATANFLHHAANLDLIRKLGRGRYEKVAPQNGESDGARG